MTKKEQLKEIITDTSHDYVAEQLGISSSMLYSILNGNRGAKKWNLRIDSFLRRYGKKQNSLIVPLVSIPSYRRIQKILELTANDATIAIITGRSGCGKTTALKSYSELHPCIYVSACANTTPAALARQLGIYFGSPKYGTLGIVTAAIVDELDANDVTIIIDEADYLPDRALEWLRQIVHDQGGCGLVLAGLPQLIGRIHNLKADHDQLRSRVRYNLQLGGITHDEALQVIRATWADLPNDVAKRIVDIADYGSSRRQDISLRTVINLMLDLCETCNGLQQKPSVMLVEDVSQLILK